MFIKSCLILVALLGLFADAQDYNYSPKFYNIDHSTFCQCEQGASYFYQDDVCKINEIYTEIIIKNCLKIDQDQIIQLLSSSGKVSLIQKCIECEEGYSPNMLGCTPLASSTCFIWNEGGGGCNQCSPGYYLDRGGCKVVNSIINNCQAYVNADICEFCEDNYLREDSNTCTKIDTENENLLQNCKTYGTSVSECILCQKGYHLSSSDRTCHHDIENCDSSYTTGTEGSYDTNCSSCIIYTHQEDIEGFYDRTHKKCYFGSDHGSYDKIEGCKQYELDEGLLICTKGDGKILYVDEGNEIEENKDFSTCKLWYDSDNCFECQNNHYFDKQSNPQCVPFPETEEEGKLENCAMYIDVSQSSSPKRLLLEEQIENQKTIQCIYCEDGYYATLKRDSYVYKCNKCGSPVPLVEKSEDEDDEDKDDDKDDDNDEDDDNGDDDKEKDDKSSGNIIKFFSVILSVVLALI